MKINKNDNYFTVFAYIIICALIIAAFAVICFNFGTVLNLINNVISIFKPVIYALVFAFVIYPIVKYFNRLFGFVEKKKPHKKLREILSLAAAYIIVIAAISTFVSRIIPQVAESYTDIADNAPVYINNAQKWIDDKLDSLPDFNISVIDSTGETRHLDEKETVPYEFVTMPQITVYDLRNNELYAIMADIHDGDINVDVSSDINKAIVSLYNMIGNLIPYVWSFVGNMITEVKNIAIGLIMSVYILLTRKYLIGQIKKLISGVFPENIKEKIFGFAKIANPAFVRFITFRTFDALIVGISYFLILTALRIPYALLISVLFGVLTLIPFVGAFIAFIPGSLIVLLSNPSKWILFVFIVLAISLLNWQIMPRIQKPKSDKLPIVYIIISVIIMGGLFGIAGMFISVPLTITLRALIREKKNIST